MSFLSKQKREVGFASVAVMALVLSAVASGYGGSDTQTSATLRVAIGVEPDTFDPMRQTTLTVQNVVDEMTETLTRLNGNRIVPGLATSWSVSRNGRAYTFTLRKGVRFHDGTPFNASAVKISLDRVIDPKNTSPNAGILTVIAGTQVINNLKVRVHLKTKAPSIIAALSNTPAAILSPASLTKFDNTYAQVKQPIGTGPYKFQQYLPGQRVTLTRNDQYWGTKPAYARHEFLITPDAAAREALLRSGGADVIVLPPLSDIRALGRDSRYKVLNVRTNGIFFLNIATDSEDQRLLRDRRVRQAFNYAINRGAIIKNVMFGSGGVPDSPIPPALTGYCAQPRYTYNPAKARALLRAAGAEGMSVKVISPTGRYAQDIQAATAATGFLRDVGINATGPRTMEWPTYISTLLAAPGQPRDHLSAQSWTPPYPDTEAVLKIYTTKNLPPAGFNISHYRNAKVDALIAEADAEIRPRVRARLYCDASKQIWADAPLVWLFIQTFPVVHSSQVTGVSAESTAKFNVLSARPAK
jgi:peptide/nickel transport system substrate-binding protein